MIGEVTRGGGLPGLSGRIALSAGMTIWHANGPGGGVTFMAKSSNAKQMF